MAKVVVIGAGLTGLSTAYHLEKQGFFDYKIFEKDDTIGGLCRSVYQDGFTFDYTGHLLHIGDDYFRSLIIDLVGLQYFNAIQRRSYIYSQNTYTDYPYQINLYGLPSETIAECIEGFVTRKKKKNITSFYDWVLNTFGAGFGNYFFFPYQKKIFAYNIKKITASWTGRFVPSTSLQQIINGALKPPFKEDSVGYNAQFFYPKQGGIFFWVNKIAQALKNPIQKNHTVIEVDLRNKRIYFDNGHMEPYEHLVSTMPLDHLLNSLSEATSSHFKQQSDKLLCNSVINFNIGVNRNDLSEKHWIYFPEAKFPFYRIGFPHNFSNQTVPVGCSSLYGEFSYLKKLKSYNTHLKQALESTYTLLNISSKDIMTEKIISIPHAYVIYDFWREKNLPKLLKRLKEYNIHSIGRYGAWKYSSMQEAVLEGKEVLQEMKCSAD